MFATKRFWIPFGVAALAYLVSFALLPGRGFFITDGGCKFIQVQTLLQNDFRAMDIRWPGAATDPEGSFMPLVEPFGQSRGDQLYGYYSPTFTLVSALAYRMMGHRGLYVLPMLCGLALLSLTWLLARQLPEPDHAAPLAMLISGLATPLWFYSLAFWEHVPATAFLVASVAFWLRSRSRPSSRALFAGGVCCAAAIAFRDELVLFAICMLAVMLFSPEGRRGAITFALGLALGLAPVGLVQQWWLGRPWGVHLSGVGTLFEGGYLGQRWDAALTLLLRLHPSVWLSILLAGPAAILLAWRPASSDARHRAATQWLAVWAIVVAAVMLAGGLSAPVRARWLLQSNGLFAAAPIVAWGLIRRRATTALDANARVLGRLIVLYVALYVIATPAANVAGVHWGCRLLLPLYSLLAVLAASTLAVRWRAGLARPGVGLVASAILASVALQLFSLRLLHERRTFDAAINTAVLERPQSFVAAVGWTVPLELSECFYAKKIFLVKQPSELGSLLLRLRDAGAPDVLVVSAVPLTGLPTARREVLVDPTGFRLELGAIDVTRIAPSQER